MNRNMFLTDLGKLLSFMTEEERARTLRDYARRLEEAGPQGEQALLAEYGSATKVAVEIFRAYKLGEPVFTSHEDEVEAEVETEAEAEVEVEVETEVQPEAEVEVEAAAETEPVFETFVMPDAIPAEMPELVRIPEAAIEAEAEPEPEIEVEAEVEPEVESEAEVEAEAEVETEVEVETEAAVELEVEAEVETEPETEPAFETFVMPEAMPEPPAEESPEPEPMFVELQPLPDFLIPRAAAEEDTELADYRIPGWAVALVMVFTCWLWIPLIVVQYVLALVLFGVFLALALGCFAACGALVISGIWAFDKIPDALLIFGAAAILLAIGLVLLWFAIWLLIVLLRLVTAGIRGTYRGIFRRKTGKERAR